MLFRPSRGRRGTDRFLTLKMILLAGGGATALAGFILEIDWLVSIAMIPLAIGLGLNLIGRRPDGDDGENTDPGDDATHHDGEDGQLRS